jgi:hypothetical protein
MVDSRAADASSWKRSTTPTSSRAAATCMFRQDNIAPGPPGHQPHHHAGTQRPSWLELTDAFCARRRIAARPYCETRLARMAGARCNFGCRRRRPSRQKKMHAASTDPNRAFGGVLRRAEQRLATTVASSAAAEAAMPARPTPEFAWPVFPGDHTGAGGARSHFGPRAGTGVIADHPDRVGRLSGQSPALAAHVSDDSGTRRPSPPTPASGAGHAASIRHLAGRCQ